jgi:hypothetical protein
MGGCFAGQYCRCNAAFQGSGIRAGSEGVRVPGAAFGGVCDGGDLLGSWVVICCGQ